MASLTKTDSSIDDSIFIQTNSKEIFCHHIMKLIQNPPKWISVCDAAEKVLAGIERSVANPPSWGSTHSLIGKAYFSPNVKKCSNLEENSVSFVPLKITFECNHKTHLFEVSIKKYNNEPDLSLDNFSNRKDKKEKKYYEFQYLDNWNVSTSYQGPLDTNSVEKLPVVFQDFAKDAIKEMAKKDITVDMKILSNETVNFLVSENIDEALIKHQMFFYRERLVLLKK
ncbi:hypothetical protein BN1013_02125 [Candidatus Rubidus massiliensis]|nr:hypothetical protein BN1013_02125 [Candidatus Rubidus massiliensis]